MPRPAKPWFRFYSEALESLKLHDLPDRLVRPWLLLLCLANISEQRGRLPNLRRVAFAIRSKEDKAQGVLDELVAAGFVDRTVHGYAIHDWDDWQFTSDVRGTEPPRNVLDSGPEPTTEPPRKRRSSVPVDQIQIQSREETEGEAVPQPEPARKLDLVQLQIDHPILNVEREWAKAQDWMKANGRRKKDEAAFFRNWLRKAEDDGRVKESLGHNTAGRNSRGTGGGVTDGSDWVRYKAGED